MQTDTLALPGRRIRVTLLALVLFLGLCLLPTAGFAATVFANQSFTSQDAVSVRDGKGELIYQWQTDQPMIPASLTKLITAGLAIDKWGIDHRFATEFYLVEQQLWVRGLADPYLISEELDILATQLSKVLPHPVQAIMVDSSYLAQEPVPGRSKVADPYNAPLSAVAANFNTVMLKRIGGQLHSAEVQTPLTGVAQMLARTSPAVIGKQPTRINVVNANNAQRHFAQLLAIKLAARNPANTINAIQINQSLPRQARLLLRHQNTHTLADVLRGTLEYSNNFIANQLFLLLAESSATKALTFSAAQATVKQLLQQAGYASAHLAEGSGLSRRNRISASDMHNVLDKLATHRILLKRYELSNQGSAPKSPPFAYAKTGTLDGVRTFAGYLETGQQIYQFVFMFNRNTSYKYREQLLQTLADQLTATEIPNAGN